MNDPTNWNPDPDSGTLAYLNAEEAQKAKALFERVQMEAYNAGVEAAAKVCDEASDLHANGEEFMDACEFCASEIRELKRIPAAGDRQEAK